MKNNTNKYYNHRRQREKLKQKTLILVALARFLHLLGLALYFAWRSERDSWQCVA